MIQRLGSSAIPVLHHSAAQTWITGLVAYSKLKHQGEPIGAKPLSFCVLKSSYRKKAAESIIRFSVWRIVVATLFQAVAQTASQSSSEKPSWGSFLRSGH